MIGRYRIRQLLGEGGMGAVYEAEQESPQRTVALKVIRAGFADAEILRRFENETQALGRLQHPGIAQIYDAGTAATPNGRQPYIAMELIRGETLVAYCTRHNLNTRDRLVLMAKICDAVQHAHQRGLIHRDLKPANILVDQDGQPKILDFGVARLTDSDAQATRQTNMGQIIGTLAYMSPEQVGGDPDEIDTRSDVYTLGVILYELLAGDAPYEIGRQVHEVVRTIREKEPTALRTINRTFRGDIETIAAKSLEKDKTRRYGSASELAADIRRYLHDEPIVARPASTMYQIRKFAWRNKALVGGIAAVFAVLVLGVVASTWEAVQARRAQKRAQEEAAVAQAVSDFLQQDLLGQASAYNQSKPDPNITVRTVLDRAAQNIGGKFKAQPAVEAAIRDTIGNAYAGLGLFPDSRGQLLTALTVSRSSLGANNPKTLDIISDLGFVAGDQGRYKEAEKLMTSAVEGDRRVLGQDNAQTLRAMNRLGVVYQSEGKYQLSESLLRNTVEIRRRVLGPDQPETASAMLNLANTYQGERKYAQATAIANEVVGIYQRKAGPDSPRTLSAIDDLALTYLDEGKYAQAEALQKEVLAGEQRVLGPEHPNTLISMTNLALTYDKEGRYAQAEALYTQTLGIERRVGGAEYPLTLGVMENLANLYGEEGKYRQQAALEQLVLNVRSRLFGQESPLTLQTMNSAASAYQGEGNFAQARDLYAKAENIDRRVLGANNLNTVVAMANIGGVDIDLGRYTQAESEIKAAIEGTRTAPGASAYVLPMQSTLAATEAAEGKFAQAEARYQQTYHAETSAMGRENPETLQTLSGLCTTYWWEKRYEEAENCSAKVVEGLRHAMGAQNPVTANAESDLALAQISRDKFTEAEPLARAALSTDENLQPDTWQRYSVESLLGEALAGQKKYAEAEPLLREGYHGMLKHKDHIDVPDLYYLELVRKWLERIPSSHGRPQPTNGAGASDIR